MKRGWGKGREGEGKYGGGCGHSRRHHCTPPRPSFPPLPSYRHTIPHVIVHCHYVVVHCRLHSLSLRCCCASCLVVVGARCAPYIVAVLLCAVLALVVRHVLLPRCCCIVVVNSIYCSITVNHRLTGPGKMVKLCLLFVGKFQIQKFDG